MESAVNINSVSLKCCMFIMLDSGNTTLCQLDIGFSYEKCIHVVPHDFYARLTEMLYYFPVFRKIYNTEVSTTSSGAPSKTGAPSHPARSARTGRTRTQQDRSTLTKCASEPASLSMLLRLYSAYCSKNISMYFR